MSRGRSGFGGGNAPTNHNQAQHPTVPMPGNQGSERACRSWMEGPVDVAWFSGAFLPPNAVSLHDMYLIYISYIIFTVKYVVIIVYLFILYTTFNGVKVRDLKKNNSYSASLFGVFALSVLHTLPFWDNRSCRFQNLASAFLPPARAGERSSLVLSWWARSRGLVQLRLAATVSWAASTIPFVYVANWRRKTAVN